MAARTRTACPPWSCAAAGPPSRPRSPTPPWRRARRARLHLPVRAHGWRARVVVGVEPLRVLAQVLVGDVDESRARRERRRLPVLATRRGGARVAHHAPDLRLLRRLVLQPSRLEVDAL